MTGEVLKSVQPIPIGNILKIYCCSNIPIFVPNIDAYNNLDLQIQYLIDHGKFEKDHSEASLDE